MYTHVHTCTHMHTHVHTCKQGENIDKHYHLMCELSAAKKQKERLETKFKRIRKLLQDAKSNNLETIKVCVCVCECACVCVEGGGGQGGTQ